MTCWERLSGALCAALIAALAVPYSASAAPGEVSSFSKGVNPAALTLAREIIALGYPVEARATMFSGALDAVMGQMREARDSGFGDDPAIKEIVDRHIRASETEMKALVQQHLPGLLDAIAIAYAREFSLKELQELRAFVGTPTGQRFFARSAALMQDPAVAAANQALMRDAFVQVQPMRKALEEELLDYFSKNPEAAKRMAEQQ